MFDELLEANAMHQLFNGRLRVKADTIGLGTSDARGIAMLAQKVSDYFDSLVHNIGNPSEQRFEASATAERITPKVLPLLRRTIATRGRAFISSIEDQFRANASKKKIDRSKHRRIGVSVFVYESPDPSSTRRRDATTK